MLKELPNFCYSMKVAETVWTKLVNDLNEELKDVNLGIEILDEYKLKKICEFLNGKIVNFNNIFYNTFENEIFCESQKDVLKELKFIMNEHLNKKINNKSDEIKVNGNAYCLKTNVDNSFEIGYLNYNLMEVVEALGYAFLYIEKMNINYPIWINEKLTQRDENVKSFARAFIMPRERFLRIVSENSTGYKCDIEKVANAFGVEYIHSYIRGRELNLWE